jgi:hypothetical protein
MSPVSMAAARARAAALRRGKLYVDLDLLDALDPLRGRPRLSHECARITGLEDEAEANQAFGLDGQLANTAGRHDVLALRIDDSRKSRGHPSQELLILHRHDITIEVKPTPRVEAPAGTLRKLVTNTTAASAVVMPGRPGSDDRYLCDFGYGCLDAAFDAVLHRHGRNRTATARTYQPDLDNAVRVAVVHELHVPAIDMEGRSDRLERSLDPFGDGRLTGRFS